ncbi:MAG: trigger factor [Methylophilaceae bacterium]|nr:trigger factor [Methylophilaceae bacterium]
MAVSVEKISNLERRMTIAVPLEPLQNQVSQRIKQISKTAKLSGFRPGKVPLKLVEQQYYNEVRDEIYSKAVENSFGAAAEENKLRVAGFPNIEHKPFDAATGQFEYVATFEVFPEVTIGDLTKVKIETPTLELADADVNKTLDVLIKQRVTFEPVKRATKKGDRVNVVLNASIDGQEIESTGEQGIDLVLGETSRVTMFDDNLIGNKPGVEKSFDITYPADHIPEQLAGKTVNYKVTINSVAQPKLPEVDAEFAKSLGVDDGNVETMREEVKASLTQEVEKRVKAKLKEQVFTALLEQANLDVPSSLVNVEVNRMIQMTSQNLQQRGVDISNINLEPTMFQDQATRSTALRLILGEIVNKNSLQANADQIRAMVDQFSQSFESPSQVVDWYYADVQRLDEPAALATEENVVAWVLGQAKVTTKKIKFDDLMGNA